MESHFIKVVVSAKLYLNKFYLNLLLGGQECPYQSWNILGNGYYGYRTFKHDNSSNG